MEKLNREDEKAKWIVREMLPGDLEQVAGIEQQTFSEPWSKQSFADSMDKESNRYLVAEQNGEILGYCGLWGIVDEGDICNVAVKERARNKGIAYGMLCELLIQGQKMGLRAYTLEVRVSNRSAIHLYHKLGFEDAGIRKSFYSKPTEDALIMWKYVDEATRNAFI